MKTKIGLIENLLSKVDNFLFGGGIGNTMLAAEGYDIGESLYEGRRLETGRKLMLEAEEFKDKFILPEDVVVADDIESQETLTVPIQDIERGMHALDIGKKTIQTFIKTINQSKLIIWNGPLGLYEKTQFRKGTEEIAKAIKNAKQAKTIIGGGDTIEAIKSIGLKLNDFDHVSTGGGAMLQFLEGTILPGVEIILKK